MASVQGITPAVQIPPVKPPASGQKPAGRPEEARESGHESSGGSAVQAESPVHPGSQVGTRINLTA